MRMPSLIAILCLGAAVTVTAADAPPKPLTPAMDAGIGPVCAAAVFRQFDFWLGEWTVSTPDGTVVGHSRITRISRGCALHERWLGRRSSGHSLSYYDHASDQWHQDWVGSGDQVLHLRGSRRGDAMVLKGTRRDKQGMVLDRITWSPLPDHGVRQHWQISRDGGTTWKTLFDSTYRSDGHRDRR